MERSAALEKNPGSGWNRLDAATLALVALLAWSGCQQHSPASGKDGGVSVSDRGSGGIEAAGLPEPTREMPTQTRLLELAGRVDAANRYPAGVLVTVEFGPQRRAICSGAIIGRRLVLTAGHCVCQGRQLASEPGSVRSIIDGSTCVKAATVQTTLYEPVAIMPEQVPARREYFEGVVKPHPELRVLLDEHGQVTASHADLAVILLEEPLGKELRPLPLADRDVEPGESIVILGSGMDELSRRYDGERRFSRNRVVEALPSGGGRMRIEQPGGHHYKEDSGGACLRESSQGPALVGVSSRSLAEGQAITSTYEYRDWLLEELQRAEARESPPHLE